MKFEEMSLWRRLPEEIQVDIFLKLPVNSILACRCVCKIWFNLLSNPKFIKNHLNLSIESINNPRLMIVQHQYRKNPIISSVDYKSISSSSNLKVVSINYPFKNKEITGIVSLGSCNGLICLAISTGIGIEAKNCICIWNPATGEYKTIKLSISEKVADDFVSRATSRYGFGYDSSIDDYKLVKMSFDNESSVHCYPSLQMIEVYTFGSNCWKTIRCTDHYVFPRSQCPKRLPGLLFNGTLHWSGATSPNQRTNSEVIVCFDINSERLTDIPFPEETMLRLRNRGSDREVRLLGNCLCAVFSYSTIQTDIGVMEDYGVTESWTKVFTISQLIIFADPFLKPIWSFEDGDILVHSRGKLSLCGQNNKTIKILLPGIHPESYVESLVSVKLGTYVKKKRTTNGNKKEPKRQRMR